MKNMSINILFTVIVFICFAVLLYNALFYNLNFEKIEANDAKLKNQLESSDEFTNIINTNGINNIPSINLITTNLNVARAANCNTSPINIGITGSVTDCIRLCANSNTKLLYVSEFDEIYYGSNRLQPGNNCILGEKPQCNTQTTIILMTINSIVCKPKFPRIIAGPLGTTVIACNNRLINDPENVLWDYKYNVRFDPFTTTIQSEDELLQDNNYRFRCKFNGRDERNNKYQEHPYDRLHPTKNYCASFIYSAHPNVKTIYDIKADSLICDCGNVTETRVQHLIPDDKSSICSDKINTHKLVVKNKQEITLTTRCFTLFSLLSDVGRYLPCSDTNQFTKQGSQTETIKVEYSKLYRDNGFVIEHPIYDKLPKNGEVSIMYDMEVC